MARIRTWVGYTQSTGVQSAEHLYYANCGQVSGATLLRTIGSVELVETVNFPNFPVQQAEAVAVGLYQATNTDLVGALPIVSDLDRDWLWYGVVHFTPDFGVANPVQSDLVWTGQVEIDSAAERKLTHSNAAFGVRIGPMGGYGGNNCRQREYGVNFVVRQLWQHFV